MWNVFIALSGAWLVSSVESPYQPPEELPVGNNMPPFRLPQTNMDTMVDLTNDLGVTILKDHSHSKGNFAFSPYGVASVLVVLYEGARGESAVQIQRAFGFPWNKDAIRVGFRNIHQHLRSYFSHEGYLSGISLNKDKSSLKPEFKKILRIYGYDVELDDEGLDNLASQDGSSNETTTVQTSPPPVTESQDIETTTEDQYTTESDLEQPNETTFPPTTTTTSEEHISNTSITTTTTELNTTTPITTTTTAEELTTTTPVITTKTKATTTKQTPNPQTTTPKEETSTPSDSTEIILIEYTTKPPEQTIEETVPTTTSESTDNMVVGMRDVDRVHISLTIDADCTKRGKRTGENSDCPTIEGKTTSPKIATDHQKDTPESVNDEIAKLDNKMLIPQANDPQNLSPGRPSWTQNSNRKSRGVENSASAVGAKSAIEMSGISKREISNIRKILNRRVHLWTAPEPRRITVRKVRTITDYLKQAQTGELSLQLQNGMYDSHVSRNDEMYQNLPRKLFLVDGVTEIPVPMMSYTYIFPFAYLPELRAKAMEFPLDDARYKLLMLLPVESRGLRQLIYDLTGYPLRYVLDSMKPAKVRATIPTFMVEGFVILTSTLKKLGIRDVFDPRKANLSGMSVDPELYVRNVEQSVTVLIRNYVEVLDIETRTTAARYIDYDFEATHPFLYFVLDTATNVALMTGQMLNPLNSMMY